METYFYVNKICPCITNLFHDKERMLQLALLFNFLRQTRPFHGNDYMKVGEIAKTGDILLGGYFIHFRGLILFDFLEI